MAGRRCTVCDHSERDRIDQALIDGRSLRDIARQFQVGKDTLHRHKSRCVPLELARAAEAASLARGDALVDQVRDLHTRALALLDSAEADNRPDTALKAIREARACLELVGKVDGLLRDSVARDDVIRLARQLGATVEKHVKDPAVLERIKVEWSRVAEEL